MTHSTCSTALTTPATANLRPTGPESVTPPSRTATASKPGSAPGTAGSTSASISAPDLLTGTPADAQQAGAGHDAREAAGERKGHRQPPDAAPAPKGPR